MLVFQIPIWRTGASHQQDDNGSQQYTTMISQRRSKERQKRQAELQQQERLLKLQKLKGPGVLIADFASEIVEIESLNTSEAEQVQEQTVDLQPDEQLTHDCSTQTEAFDHLYRSVVSPSVKDCRRTDASTQTEEFGYLFTHSSTSKPFMQNYFRDDNAKVSFYTGPPTYEVLEATSIHVSPSVKCRTEYLSLFQELTMVLMKLRLNVPHLDLAYRFGVSQATVSRTFAHWLFIMDVQLSPPIRWPEREELWRSKPRTIISTTI